MATINPHTTRATGTVLTAAIYNADHQNHITNATNINAEFASLIDVGAVTGIVVSNGAGVVSGRSLAAGQAITITNPNGVAAAPNIGVSDDPTFTGFVTISNGDDIAPSAGGTGQLVLVGNAYAGYIAMDAAGMHVGHNASNRSLTLDVNEVARLTIASTGAITTTGNFTVGAILTVNTTMNVVGAATFNDPVTMTETLSVGTTATFTGTVNANGALNVAGLADFNGTITAEAILANGNVRGVGNLGTPALSFTANPDTGFYENAGVVHCVADGQMIFTFKALGANVLAVGLDHAITPGTDDGVSLEALGFLQASRTSNTCTRLIRNGTDGRVANTNKGATNVGGISVTAAATSFDTSSDEQLKTFLHFYSPEEAMKIILADPVWFFEWNDKSAVAGKKTVGWGAQTSHKVFNEFATPGHGKPGDEDFQPWGTDHAKRVPFMWAAIPWLLQRIEALEARQ